MTSRLDIASMVRDLQDVESYRELTWEGTFQQYLDIVPENPSVTRTAFQRLYDMILSLRHRGVHGVQEAHHALQVLRRPHRRTARRHLRARPPADAAGRHLQVRRQGLRHRAARPAAARPGRLVQVHDRPPAEEGAGGLLARRTRARSTLLLRGRSAGTAADGEQPRRLPDARGAAAPDPARVRAPRAGRLNEKLPDDQQASASKGDLCPFCRQDVRGLCAPVRRRLDEGHRARQGAPPGPVREGPRRHRHLPAQGREEPGLHRAHRRHQLPQDRRVRLRLATRARSTSTAN